nr:MAG TPA: hypothetical protein [Caudoviricetes sp.]
MRCAFNCRLYSAYRGQLSWQIGCRSGQSLHVGLVMFGFLLVKPKACSASGAKFVKVIIIVAFIPANGASCRTCIFTSVKLFGTFARQFRHGHPDREVFRESCHQVPRPICYEAVAGVVVDAQDVAVFICISLSRRLFCGLAPALDIRDDCRFVFQHIHRIHNLTRAASYAAVIVAATAICRFDVCDGFFAVDKFAHFSISLKNPSCQERQDGILHLHRYWSAYRTGNLGNHFRSPNGSGKSPSSNGPFPPDS